jgi:hypothetical protein
MRDPKIGDVVVENRFTMDERWIREPAVLGNGGNVWKIDRIDTDDKCIRLIGPCLEPNGSRYHFNLHRVQLENFAETHRLIEPDEECEPRGAARPGTTTKDPVAVTYSLDVMRRSYKAASDIHEAADQRVVTMLVLAAWIIEVQSRMAKCPPEETLDIVRGFIAELRDAVK